MIHQMAAYKPTGNEDPWARSGDGEVWQKIDAFKAEHAPEMLVEVLTCDKCGAPETPSNPIEFRQCGTSGYGAFINEGPPEWFSECAACASEDEVPY